MILADGIIGQIMEPVEFHEKKETASFPQRTGQQPVGVPQAIVPVQSSTLSTLKLKSFRS